MARQKKDGKKYSRPLDTRAGEGHEGWVLSPKELERYLHEHIPLSRVMRVTVMGAGEEAVVLGAPLAPNINHHETLFGGSASAVAILAAWSLVHFRLHEAGLLPRLVIQRSSLEHDLPIAGAFTARSFLEEKAWGKFREQLERKGRARITASAVLEYDGRIAARFTGDYVALPGRG